MVAKKTAGGGRGKKTTRRTATRRKKGATAKKDATAKKGATAKKRGAAKKGSAAKTSGPKLYTLTEVGKLASVSMPTLQKYKKKYADRIPSVGEGRKQRYPREAVAVLRQLKKENLARRGRPPKAAGRGRKAAAKRAARRSPKTKGLLTLTEISRRTKISYPTVSRYVKLFLDRIPHEGNGRQRRFPPEAVPIFEQLRRESRPGRPAAAGKASTASGRSAGTANVAARLRRLEKGQADLGRQIAKLVKELKKPLRVTIRRS